jgi:2-amino-4-hydroxy-6-hydroxymethyldihydropteridine diphosphokinase
MQDVYLLLGSNLGDREIYLHKATEHIRERVGEIKAESSFYETAAWGVNDQPPYINQVLRVLTNLSAQGVLAEVLDVEKVLGRERLAKWGSRVIDIDILFYGDAVINDPDLVIPHPYFQDRRFAVEPMMELNATFVHPLLKKSIKSIALELTDKLSVERLN